MATSNSFCGVCDRRHVYKSPIVWCPECDERLCTECEEHHSLSKSSRNHNTIPISEYQKLTPDVLNISQYCKIHNEKYQIYCKIHESPCCSNCTVESHNECRDFVKLVEVIKNAKASSAFYEMEQTFIEVSENIKKIRENRQDNLKTLSEGRALIEQQIKKTRITINNHLDKIQENMIKELYKVEKHEKEDICQLITLLEENENEIAKYQRNIPIIKQHASDLQAFLAMKQFEKDVLEKDEFLQSLIDKNTLKQNALIFHPNATLLSFVFNEHTFGDVLVETKPHDVVLTRKKERQGQITVPKIESKSIEDINLKLHRTIHGSGNNVYGCCLLPDGKMAFTNYHNSVRILNREGLHDFDMKIPNIVYDVDAMNESNTLVVTAGSDDSRYLTIIDTKDKQVTKTIFLDSVAYGIAGKDAELIYSAREKGIQMISLQDESVQNIVRDGMPHYCYIATFNGFIYHTNNSTDTVTCYDLKGNKQWTFMNNAVLKYPVGIAIDKDGNVFVVGNKSENIVVISADGKRNRELLSSKDGLENPWGMRYNRSTNQLLVANNSNRAFIYSLV